MSEEEKGSYIVAKRDLDLLLDAVRATNLVGDGMPDAMRSLVPLISDALGRDMGSKFSELLSALEVSLMALRRTREAILEKREQVQ